MTESNKVDEKHKTDADREAERIAEQKKLNDQLAEKQVHDEAKAGMDRTQPGLTDEPEPLAKNGETD